MWDFQNHRRKVYEFYSLKIEDMKRMNQEAKEVDEERDREIYKEMNE